MIVHPCPACQKPYEWDPVGDTYVGSTEYGDVDVWFVCTCGAKIAAMSDGVVYVPSKEIL